MTHLSDFSYLERCSMWVYITVYLTYSIYVSDRFRCLKFKSIFAGELKSIITILLILMILLQFMWDIASTYVKYNEGFTVYNGNIITKPFVMWTSVHQRTMMAMDYVECVTFSLQVGVFFLMQSFWNYLSNSVAKKSFMSSFEFKFYILWAFASMALFPILQWVFRDDIEKREGVPQLAYALEALVTSLLGIRSHFRFKRIIALSHRNNSASSKAIVTRLSYFKDMNALISVILFSYASSLIILCADGLTENKVINSSKFATDTIIANANICTVFLFLLLISIFHPRPQYSREFGESTSTHNESNFRYSSNNNNNRAQAVSNNNYIVNESPRGISEDVTSSNKFTGAAITTNNINNNKNGGFMRAMSPVTVDYPHSMSNDTVPLTASTGTGRPLSPPETQMSYQQQARSVAVEDPYSSQSVMFSMVDVKQQQPRYDSPNINHQDIPMCGMNNSRSNDYAEEDHYMEYGQTTAPHKIRRPSWERGNNMSELHMQPSSPLSQQQPGDQMVRDWLWQSPDRRNT